MTGGFSSLPGVTKFIVNSNPEILLFSGVIDTIYTQDAGQNRA